MTHPSIRALEKQRQKGDLPPFRIGDTLSVHTRIIEGDRERVQVFTGVLIGRKGAGLSETITLRRTAYGEGMERVLPLHSPHVKKIEIVQKGKVRRAKLYYLAGKVGKRARVKTQK